MGYILYSLTFLAFVLFLGEYYDFSTVRSCQLLTLPLSSPPVVRKADVHDIQQSCT